MTIKNVGRNSRAFSRLLRIGYKERKGRLYYPDKFKALTIKRDHRVNIDRMVKLLRTEKYQKIILRDNRGRQTVFNYKKNNDELFTWFYAVINYHHDYNMDSPSYMLLMKKRKDSIKIGPSYTGITNCFVKCVNDFVDKNGYTKYIDGYEDGLFQEDIPTICRSLRIRILLHLPIETLEYGAKYKKEHKTLHLYYNNNHVTLYNQNKFDKEIEYISLDDKNIPPEDIQNIIPNLMIETSDKIYVEKDYVVMKNDEVIYKKDLSDTKCVSGIQYFAQLFADENKHISRVPRDHDNISAIKSILFHGITYNSSYENPLCVYDLKGAYSNYTNFPSYTGFPDNLNTCIKGPLDLNIINNYEGFALCSLTNLFTGNIMERWVSFPYIRNRLKHKEKITITYYLIGNRTHLKLKTFNNLPNRIFHKVLGSIARKTKIISFATTDDVLADSFGGEKLKHPDVYLCTEEVDSIPTNFYPHISQYIYSYTEIQMENMFRKLKNVKRIWIDGIGVPEIQISPPQLYKLKSSPPQTYDKDIIYPPPLLPTKFSDEFVQPYRNIYIHGGAGTGKTTLLKKLYNQTSNAIILVPTNELKLKFPNTNCETVDMFITRHMRSDNIFIDETSMVGIKKLSKITSSNIVYFGDPCQLPPIKDKMLLPSSMKNFKLTKIHRQSDVDFQSLLNTTRETGDISYIKQKITIEDAIKNKYTIICSRHSYINRINKLGVKIHGIIGSPVRFYKTNKYKKYNAGTMATIEEATKTHYTILGYKFPISSNHFKLAYAITYHAVQGKTIDKPVVLYKKRLFDKTMTYVGVSRVRKLSQLFII